MTDRPILFSVPMVRALLAGTKTQTRRALNPQPFMRPEINEEDGFFEIYNGDELASSLRMRIRTGDRLWVRESHQFRGGDYGDSDGEIEWFRCYGSDGAPDNWDPAFPAGFEPSRADSVSRMTDAGDMEHGVIGYVTKRRPGIHMPRWASRLTLTVTDVRVERLQDISEEDAIAEGCGQYASSTKLSRPFNPDWKGIYREGYAELWNEINGAGAWEANPWVSVYVFEVRHGNIDSLGECR